jgi:hypothetical protein
MAADERFDVTARKFHQWVIVLLSAVAFVVAGPIGGAVMVVVGLVMLIGRFRDQADLFRGFYGAVLAPRGILKPRMVVEDRATRRVARVMGGSIQLVAGLLVIVGLAQGIAWALVVLIGAMVALDAALDFCALCFVVHQFRRGAGWQSA